MDTSSRFDVHIYGKIVLTVHNSEKTCHKNGTLVRSEYDTHVLGELGYLICLRHLSTSKLYCFFFKKREKERESERGK